MINYMNLILTCITLFSVMSIVLPIIIEGFKKIFTEEKIIEIFKSIDIFSFIVSFVLGLIVYVVYIVFGVIGVYTVNALDIVKLIIFGIGFSLISGWGSQVGYDKVIKVIKEIIEKFKSQN